MARLAALLLILIVLAGCGSNNTRNVLNPKTPISPEEPQDNETFTGEPTPVVLEVRRQGPAFRPMLLASSDTDEMLVANFRIRKFNEYRRVTFEWFHQVEFPATNTSVSLPLELPAHKYYEVTVDIYNPSRISSEGYYYLIEASPGEEFSVPARQLNEVTVTTGELAYTIIAPEELYSGGDLRQIDIIIPPEYGIMSANIHRFYGLKTWSQNGTDAFWKANAGHAGMGIPNTGWMDKGSAPRVDRPTTLYYQFRVCSPLALESGTTFMCKYIPDLEAGEELFEITIYPTPPDFPY